MFEKEAEERAKRLEEEQTLGFYDNDEELARDVGFNKGEVCGYEEGFKEGAEFGYNKASEWHYVKDGDLPTHTRQVLVYLKSDDVDIDCYEKGLGWKNHLNEQIKAWKEIVLPKRE